MKLLHTADWQLGRAFTQMDDAHAHRLREARLETLGNLLELARREKVDAIVAAGDLLEDNRIQYRYVERMARLLESSPAPVLVLPGNHDPLTYDSPYQLHATLFQGKAMVLGSEEPVSIGDATFYPCPARARFSRDNPCRWIPPRAAGDGIRIGIAHGSVGTPDDCHPIPKDTAEALGLDYLALGHWHGVKSITPRTWYCGTPEPTAFAEAGGCVLIVNVAGPGQTPEVREYAVCTYRWHDEARDVHAAADVAGVRRLLEEKADPDHGLLRLRLTGALPQQEVATLDRLQDEFANRYFHLRIEQNVTVRSDGEPVFRHPLLREMSDRLVAKTTSPEEADAARRALSMLVSLVRESGLKELG